MPTSCFRYSLRCDSSCNLTSRQIEAIVCLHREAFPGFFLTFLGPRFLQVLYRSFWDADTGICVVAQYGDELIGFAAGTTEPETFFRTVLRRRVLSFVVAAVPGLLRNPIFVIRKCFGALFYRGEKPAAMPTAGLLSSLAVSPHVSGRGVGRQLVEAFCGEARERGVDAVYLATDASDNDSVNRFYEKCGFHLVDTFERPGRRRMNRWAKTLGLPIAPPNEAARRVDHVASSTL